MKIERPKTVENVLNENGNFCLPSLIKIEDLEDPRVKGLDIKITSDDYSLESFLVKGLLKGLLINNNERLHTILRENREYIDKLKKEIEQVELYSIYVEQEISAYTKMLSVTDSEIDSQLSFIKDFKEPIPEKKPKKSFIPLDEVE